MNDLLSQAIKEAYASAPVDEIELNTLEIRHPSFIDDEGQPTAIRVVRDYTDLTAYLEADAPLNGGEEVTFIGYPFDFTLPTIEDGAAGLLQITIDNTSPEIGRYIELANESPEPIEITYRPYLASDLSGPQMDPPLHMEVLGISIDTGTNVITLKAGWVNLVNKLFPGKVYTYAEYPGLVR